MLRFELCDLGQRRIDRPDTGGVPGSCYTNGQLIEIEMGNRRVNLFLSHGLGLPAAARAALFQWADFCRSNQNFVG